MTRDRRRSRAAWDHWSDEQLQARVAELIGEVLDSFEAERRSLDG